MADKAVLLDWLLEADDSMVRYNTLVNVLDRPVDSTEVLEARRAMMSSRPVSTILKGLEAGIMDKKAVAQWGEPAAMAGYMPKYRGAVWRLLFLAQAGADPNNPQVRSLCEHVLENAYSEKHGTFAVSFRARNGYNDALMPCFMGNMVWSLCIMGYGDRPEVSNSFRFLVEHQRFDDGGWKTPNAYPYRGRRDRCWGAHTCYWGVTKLLKAMTAVPNDYWTDEALDAKRRSIEFVLLHRLIWSSHSPDTPISTKATNPTGFTAPLTYYDDAIEIASNLISLGARHEAIDSTIEYIKEKADANGRWQADKTHGPIDAPFARKGQESKWVTYRVARMLKLAGMLQ
ncbi:hypothetical protein A3K81_04580 [Candidatus Bathyarchaeota archaeon RBG_13_60_20]|nr:MAG: hypothetical protein A3K81_04580 [Candidatus Bathyarchaeota archaeon RBG_13_60_20]